MPSPPFLQIIASVVMWSCNMVVGQSLTNPYIPCWHNDTRRSRHAHHDFVRRFDSHVNNDTERLQEGEGGVHVYDGSKLVLRDKMSF